MSELHSSISSNLQSMVKFDPDRSICPSTCSSAQLNSASPKQSRTESWIPRVLEIKLVFPRCVGHPQPGTYLITNFSIEVLGSTVRRLSPHAFANLHNPHVFFLVFRDEKRRRSTMKQHLQCPLGSDCKRVECSGWTHRRVCYRKRSRPIKCKRASTMGMLTGLCESWTRSERPQSSRTCFKYLS